MKKVILIVSVLSIAFFACKKKDSSSSTPVYTKIDTLQNGIWKLVSASAGGGLIDLMPNLKDCQKDNFYTFKADKTITIDEGATKCATTDVSPRTDGNWTLTSDYTQMSISGSTISSLGLGTLTATVVKLESTSLELKKDTTISGFATTINIKFSNTK